MAPPDVAMCDWAPLRVFPLIPMGSRSLAGKVDLHPQAKPVDVWWPERKDPTYSRLTSYAYGTVVAEFLTTHYDELHLLLTNSQVARQTTISVTDPDPESNYPIEELKMLVSVKLGKISERGGSLASCRSAALDTLMKTSMKLLIARAFSD
ncbi:hypothetical protein D5086_009771 [Populus alba]|uniref:Uncharacterized protein n=2 Tax=Populus TaxID=3689 RepID=A0ACC4C843_POPAL|nr:hypothetical protein NC653_012722 [Populus alba x Populus x berolinensis]